METIKTFLHTLFEAIGMLTILSGIIWFFVSLALRKLKEIEYKQQVKANKLFIKQILQK